MGERAPVGLEGRFDELFRRQYARLVAGLTRRLGTRHLGLVEDVASEAWLAALRTWPTEGVPKDPLAWLFQVARRRALDALRRRRGQQEVDLLPELDTELGKDGRDPSALANAGADEEIADDTLRMIFTCCHPALAAEARVALTLKTLCGLDVEAIAAAFLASPTTIEQRLVRAKRRLEELDTPFAVPGGAELPRRLDAVLDVLYLMFNAGYSAPRGGELVRADLVREALRLTAAVADLPETSLPRVHALLALMYLQGARLPSRTGEAGDLLTLARQDRSRWDRTWLIEGVARFERSMQGREISAFHIEAAIAAEHASAPSYAATAWDRILARYDELVALAPSPVVLLARSVALAKVRGIDAALAELDSLALDARLERYHLLYAVRAACLWHQGRREQALAAFEAALERVRSPVERRLLEQRLEACAAGRPAEPF